MLACNQQMDETARVHAVYPWKHLTARKHIKLLHGSYKFSNTGSSVQVSYLYNSSHVQWQTWPNHVSAVI